MKASSMKKSKRGWPSSERRNEGFEKAVKSWIMRAEEVTLMFLK